MIHTITKEAFTIMKTFLCYIFSYLIEAFIIWQYASHLFQRKSKKWITCSVLIILYGILFFLSTLDLFWLNAISFFTINFIFIFLFFERNIPSCAFHAGISLIMMGLGELIAGGMFSGFLSNFYTARSDTTFLFLYAILTKSIYGAFMYLLLHLLSHSEESQFYNSKETVWLVCVPFASFGLIMSLLVICHTTPATPLTDHMILISALLILWINMLIWIIYHYIQRKNKDFTEMQLSLQKENASTEFYQMLLTQNEQQNILIHDIKKHLQAIALLNDQGNSAQITQYISQITSSFDLHRSIRVCDNDFLNIIFSRYSQECSSHNISLHFDIRNHAVSFLLQSELTSLFCNLLDNAMRAAADCSSSYIELKVNRKPNTPYVILTMVNSCMENPYTPDGILVSLKQDKSRHGYGMKSIQRIVTRYHGDLKSYYQNEDHTFHTILTLQTPI